MAPDIEVAKLKKTFPDKEEFEFIIKDLLQKGELTNGSVINLPKEDFSVLNQFKDIHSILINDIPDKFVESEVNFYYYEFTSESEGESEVLESHDNEQVSASVHWILPNRSSELHGLWESLVYDDRLKENILDFSKSILLFSNMGVNQNVVSCNRLILLHGPPGSGKTSLAKAIAQKLSIQMHDKYQFTHLFEINSHSLFSRWFSESGKLVMKMFEQIQEIVEMESSLVIVLIDEVESIAFARANISTSAEPSDAVRVVNSFLTQLDKIKKYPNVLIIATSNLTKSIDLAFLDRADIVQFVGQPSANAIYKIISSAVVELALKGLIKADSLDDGRDDFNINSIQKYENFRDIEQFAPFSSGNIMAQVCKEAVGLTGRGLRKLPFLAHALFLKKNEATLREFLIAMRSAVDYTKRNKQNIGQFN